MTIAAIALGQNAETVYSPDGVDITRLVRLHRLPRRTIIQIRALRALRGKTSQRPDAADSSYGQAWRVADAKVQRELDNERPYRGSRREAQDRSRRRWNGRR